MAKSRRSKYSQLKVSSDIARISCGTVISTPQTDINIQPKDSNDSAWRRQECTALVEPVRGKIEFRNVRHTCCDALDLQLSTCTPRPSPFHNPQTKDFIINTNQSTSFCFLEPTFKLFPKLPLELRFRIWQLAANEGQVIGFRDLEGKPALCGNSAQCSLMLACREARQETVKVRKNLHAGISSSAPKMYCNLNTDTVWLTIERGDIYDCKSQALWTKIVKIPTRNVRKLAISYSLFKRRWDDLNAMVFKLDLEELILLVDAEKITEDDTAVLIKPRSAVGRRSATWRDWDEVTRSEVRQLKDCLSHAQHSYQRAIIKGASPEGLLARGKRDLSNWKFPRITIRDIVNARHALPEELAAIADEESMKEQYDEGSDTDLKESSEYD